MITSSSTEKIRLPQRQSRMTVHQRNEESRETSHPVVSPRSKNHWQAMDNGSSSWDRNSRGTSSSWPGDMEEAATRKVLQLWDAIERNLFDEDEQTSALEAVAEECNQWKTQLVHLRVVGKSAPPVGTQETSEAPRSTSRRSRAGEDRFGEEIIIQDSLDRVHDPHNDSARQARLAEDKNEVFDQILDFVCSEFSKPKENESAADALGRDLSEILRVTPAPSYSGRRTTKGRKKRDNGGDSRKSSANANRAEIVASASRNDNDKNRSVSAANRGIGKNGLDDDKNENDAPQVARNKLGTVFNEKIVVSPVPFVVSSRESFTTLRTTPISFRAQTFEISTPQATGLGRYMNSASKTNSAQRFSGLRIPQSHSAWQTPVCPTVWPKNIRLAPIDPSRLPSSKNRLAMVDPKAPVWLMRLTNQPNIFMGDIPYVPVPLEEIDEYTRSADFEEDCIKTVETIGILRPVNPRLALLVAMPGGPRRKLRLVLENFYPDYLYPMNPNGHAAKLRDAWKVVRVFGLLGTRNKKTVLEVEICEPVDDPESASKLLQFLSGIARRRISMFICEADSCPHLDCCDETPSESEEEAAETMVVE